MSNKQSVLFCSVLVQEEMPFKYFLSRALAAILLGGANHLGNFGGHYEKQFCESILKLDQ